MPYTPPYPAWHDDPTHDTPIDAASLQTIDDGIDLAHTNIDAHLVDAVDAHDASAISVSPTGNLSSTDVQSALAELDSDITAGGIPGTIFDNKGELIGASAADTPAIVAAASANGLFLKSDSNQATGLVWAAVTVGAAAVSIADAGGYYTGTDVEAALQEVGADITTLQNSSPIGLILALGG